MNAIGMPLNGASTSTQTTQDRESMIRDRAYFRAQERGFSPGGELEDWLAAEKEVNVLIVAAQIPLGFYG